jgi:ankyrin repeat protein
MGAGASSTASNDQRSATSSGASLLSRISVSSVAQASKHSRRIQELESQVRELKAQSLVKTLSDAAISSLKRRDKVYMEEVFNRHSEPVGLCANNLVSALHEMDAEIFSANISEVDAATALKKVDSGKKGYATFNEFCIAAKIICAQGDDHEDEVERVAKLQKARDVFLRFAKVKGLSSEALIKALTEVHAPVLLSSQDCSPKQIFRRADANTSGSVDLIEFMRAAELPDDLEMILEDNQLAILAPAVRAYLLQSSKAGDDQMKSFSKMQCEDLFAAVDASMALLKQQLEAVHAKVKRATENQVQLQEAASKEPTKFSTFKASGGTIDHFFEGLEDRIGSPNLDFKKAMCSEHTTLEGSEITFTSGNYKITTQPKKEWAYVVDGMKCPDMDHGREIKSIRELKEMPLSERAELEEAEVIAIVLYTGPMFVIYNAILRQYPENIFEDFSNARNLFSTTIFVLVSAIQKLSRCMDIPSGTLLYRGLGGSMELPDTFFVPSDECKTPNALGYCEFGFMSTTADRKIAVRYSGVAEGKPKASIMEIHPNSVDRGADISDFSQYPQEKEFLFVPCSFVQGRGRQRTEITDGGGILSVIPVSVNINLKTETINELQEKKKRLHIAAFKSLISETMQWIIAEMDTNGRAETRAAADRSSDDTLRDFLSDWRENFLYNLEWSLEDIMEQHNMRGFDEYTNNLKYKALVTHMLNAQEWAKQTLKLWFENPEVKIVDLIGKNMKTCHRKWLSFLRQQKHATAEVKEERKDAAVKILQCKGLIATDDPSTEKVEDEPIIYAAVADGWALEDLKFLIDAGANVSDVNSDGDSALHAALRHRDELAVMTLAEAGADVTQISWGLSPMHLAACEGLVSCIEVLFGKGARVDVGDEDGCTPMHFAALNGRASCIEVLLSKTVPYGIGALVDVDNFEFRQAHPCHELDEDKVGTPMHFAAAGGHASCIQVLKGAGGDINCRDKNGKTPLYFAAKNGHTPCLDFLFKNDADVKICGEEALIAAAKNGHAPCLVVLIQNEADVKQSGETALVESINYSHTSCVDVLLQNGAAFKDGSSPIHYAAAEQRDSIVLFLLAQGAHVDARDQDGITPMHYAAKTRNRDLMNSLFEKGADVNTQDNDGKTPMHWAAASGSESCIEFLVTHGASDSVHARDKDEKTPLHHAAAAARPRHLLNTHSADWQELAQFKEDGSEYVYDWDVRPWSEKSGWWQSCVEFLVANGADVNSQDKDGKTSVHYAATMGNESNRKENPKGKVSYIELLFAKGADSNARDKNGKTPLHYAVAAKPVKDAKCFPYFFEDISRNIEFICEKGADVNARDQDGKSPIHCAISSGSESIIKFLCEKGVDVNTQDNAGKAPLHYAVLSGSESVIKFLCEKGVDVNTQDNAGKAPLHYAVLSGSESVIKFLCEKGADVNTQDNAGKAPLHYAIDARGAEATKVIMCLVDKGANVNSRDK